MRTLLEFNSDDPLVVAQAWIACFGEDDRTLSFVSYATALRRNWATVDSKLRDLQGALGYTKYLLLHPEHLFIREGEITLSLKLRENSIFGYHVGLAAFCSNTAAEKRLMQLHQSLTAQCIEHVFAPFEDIYQLVST